MWNTKKYAALAALGAGLAFASTSASACGAYGYAPMLSYGYAPMHSYGGCGAYGLAMYHHAHHGYGYAGYHPRHHYRHYAGYSMYRHYRPVYASAGYFPRYRYYGAYSPGFYRPFAFAAHRPFFPSFAYGCAC